MTGCDCDELELDATHPAHGRKVVLEEEVVRLVIEAPPAQNRRRTTTLLHPDEFTALNPVPPLYRTKMCTDQLGCGLCPSLTEAVSLHAEEATHPCCLSADPATRAWCAGEPKDEAIVPFQIQTRKRVMS